MIKAVFFDLYNTLLCFDPPREEIEAQALKEFGINREASEFRYPFLKADEYFFEENARLRISDRPDEEKQAVYARHQETVLTEAGITPNRQLVAAIMHRWAQTKLNQMLFDDVLPTLKELKDSYTLGLISNIDSDIKPTLEKLGLAPLLDIIVTSLETGYTKPHPEIFNEAIKRARVSPAEAMYIGDQYQIDVVAAARAGMRAVLLDRYNHFEGGIDYPRIQSLSQLKKRLKSL